MLTKEAKREFAEERKMIRLDEAATAIADILEANKCDRPGVTMKTRNLFDLVEHQATANRKKEDRGYVYIPSVNNRVVPPPNDAFCRVNWRDIKIFAAECGYFVVSRLSGEPRGVRLGDLDEFCYCQGSYIMIAEGMADTHNERATTIEDQGGKAQSEMVVRIRKYREEKERKAQDDTDNE